MQAKQSFTASGLQSRFGVLAPHPSIHAQPSRLQSRTLTDGRATLSEEIFAAEIGRAQPSPTTNQQEGLLHDARNLVGTIGLYCDLLSMPGVLKPEHHQYPEELRLLGARSKSLIDHLMQSLFALQGDASLPNGAPDAESPNLLAQRESRMGRPSRPQQNRTTAVSLASIVERCSGLLKRVANGRVIKVTYGPAARVPVRVPEEAVERILVNLVRNAAAALADQTPASGRLDREALENQFQAISILVGPMISRVGEHKPWPFQRVRLVVEDKGCGMSSRQLDRLLGADDARSGNGHGVGFGVVRDLVAASEGEIRVMSEPQNGTRVQIEWPIIATSATEIETMDTIDLPPMYSRSVQHPAGITANPGYLTLRSSHSDVRTGGTL